MVSKKNNFDINKLIHWLIIIPTIITELGFLFSGLMVVPKWLDNYEKLGREHDKLIEKVYGASPDDIDGIRASIEREMEVDNIIKDAKDLIPKSKHFFEHELPEIKKDIQKLKDR